METLLQTSGLSVWFSIKRKKAKALRDVSVTLRRGETLVVLGESGSGKSTLMKAILKVLPRNADVQGNVLYDGQNLIAMKEKQLRSIHGDRVAMIFQDSLSALDPMYTVGRQITETIRAHTKLSAAEAEQKAVTLLRQVGIPSPAERMKVYPHEMSGGMRQRAVIAMALSCNPDILLADEPTTALDVTIQKQILELFRTLQRNTDMGIMLVTHDIGVAAQVADRIVIMYGGIVVESGTAQEVLQTPANPYTVSLIASIPKRGNKEKLVPIKGQPPMITHMPSGCPFSDRCPYVKEICRKELPALKPISGQHFSACHL